MDKLIATWSCKFTFIQYLDAMTFDTSSTVSPTKDTQTSELTGKKTDDYSIRRSQGHSHSRATRSRSELGKSGGAVFGLVESVLPMRDIRKGKAAKGVEAIMT